MIKFTNEIKCISGYQGSFLYWVDSSHDGILRMSSQGGQVVQINVSTKVQIQYPWGITHDPQRNTIYWTDYYDGHEYIGRVSLTTGQVDTMNLTSGKHI